MTRPRLAYWLKTHWWIARLLPWGSRVWNWADDRIDEWHRLEGRE